MRGIIPKWPYCRWWLGRIYPEYIGGWSPFHFHRIYVPIAFRFPWWEGWPSIKTVQHGDHAPTKRMVHKEQTSLNLVSNNPTNSLQCHIFPTRSARQPCGLGLAGPSRRTETVRYRRSDNMSEWECLTKCDKMSDKMPDRKCQIENAGWWFGTFSIFPYIGNNHPNWLIFFRGVETTNQDKISS